MDQKLSFAEATRSVSWVLTGESPTPSDRSARENGQSSVSDDALWYYLDPGTDVLRPENHPHSAVFQIWVDLGAIGAALMSVTVILLGEVLVRQKRGTRAMLSGVMAGALAVWSVSHGM